MIPKLNSTSATETGATTISQRDEKGSDCIPKEGTKWMRHWKEAEEAYNGSSRHIGVPNFHSVSKQNRFGSGEPAEEQ
jgi:uncharacterized protein YccT (UPF0319 family)